MTDPISRLNATLEGRYRVERELGRGGMATVYLADDLRHERKVALKVLRPELAAVIGAERFLAEIKTTANLQHPHILPLHDSGEADGILYYVMPYVEGESLRQRLNRERQLPVEEAVDIAVHIADALDYAHRKGIVHRDIKPANVLMADGGAVVTDFGIALALGAAGGDRLTETGLSLGTPHYMSPEQATGDQPVGPATDIYALGCVLYEMLVGEPPYTGSTAQAVLGKVVMGTAVPVREHRKSVPPNVEAAVVRALEKVPADRFRTAADVARALSDPGFRYGTERPTRLVGVTGRRRVALPLGVLAVALLAFWAGARSRSALTPASGNEPVRLVIPLPPDQRPLIRFNEAPMDISPDGRFLAYVATSRGTRRLYVRPLGELTPHPVPGTEGAYTPFFSPDGRSVGYFANGKLWRVVLDGGAPLPICDVGSARFGATWGPDGTIYYGDDPGLRAVSADGGAPKVVSRIDTEAGEVFRGLPQVLPDGRVLISVGTSTGPHTELLDPATGESRVVLDGAGGARFVPPDFLVFGSAGVTQVVAFDAARAEVTSPAASIPDDVYIEVNGHPLFTVSDDGTMVYLAAGSPVETMVGPRVGDSATLVRVGRDGRETVLWKDWPGEGSMRLSPDSRRAVDFVSSGRMDVGGSNFRIWAFDLERQTSTRLTTAATSIYPLWAPDGEHVVFSSTLSGPMSLYREASDGASEPEPLLVAEGEQYASSWSPDGRLLAYFERSPTTGLDIWVLPMEGDGEAEPFVRTADNESWPAFSPDGRWMAYSSDASGRGEVYIQPFPGPGERTLVSNAGGSLPQWSRDGGEIFYRQGDGLWAVKVRTDPKLTVDAPELLFRGDYEGSYDVDPSGDGFVMLKRGASARPSQFDVVQNWSTELRRLVPREQR